jgi:hypothetical protein
VTPETTVETPYIVVISGDVLAPDTLLVGNTGDIRAYPNPFPYDHGEAIEFITSTDQPYTIEVYTLTWQEVWTYTSQAPPGFYHVHWPGTDLGGAHVPPGYYWIVVRRDGIVHASLVMKEAP